MDSKLISCRSHNRTTTWHVIIIFVLSIFTYFPVWKNLVTTWGNSENYSHAFAILPVSLWLIWMKKEKLQEVPVSVSKAGYSLFLFSILLYLLAFFGNIATIASLSLIVTIIALVWTLFGPKITRLLSFPLFFLFLMVPIPAQIYSASTIPLQLFVSKISASIAIFFDIPLFREGNVLHLPGKTLQVVEACSGMRSIISLFTLGLLFGYISLKMNRNRILLAVTTIPVALFINIIRIIIMILAYYYFGFDLSSEKIHAYYGIVIFTMSLLLVFSNAKLLAMIEK